MNNSFKFDPSRWLNNPALRLCSLEARGLWIDMLSIMANNGGKIPIKSGTPTDEVVSILIGVDLSKAASLLCELSQAGVIKLLDGVIASSGLVKSSEFRARAKAHGQEGQRRKKARQVPPVRHGSQTESGHATLQQIAAQANPPNIGQAQIAQSKVGVVPPAVKLKPAKALPWYQSPAGWQRKGGEQAVSIGSMSYEEFQVKVAKNLPDGAHLEVLAPWQVAQIKSAQETK